MGQKLISNNKYPCNDRDAYMMIPLFKPTVEPKKRSTNCGGKNDNKDRNGQQGLLFAQKHQQQQDPWNYCRHCNKKHTLNYPDCVILKQNASINVQAISAGGGASNASTGGNQGSANDNTSVQADGNPPVHGKQPFFQTVNKEYETDNDKYVCHHWHAQKIISFTPFDDNYNPNEGTLYVDYRNTKHLFNQHHKQK